MVRLPEVPPARPASVAALVEWVRRALPALAVALAAAFALRRLDNTDTWWHLAAGRWIAEHGTVPRTDTLSWTVADHSWTDLQWLFEVGIHALHRAGGPTLLVVTPPTAYALATPLLPVDLPR